MITQGYRFEDFRLQALSETQWTAAACHLVQKRTLLTLLWFVPCEDRVILFTGDYEEIPQPSADEIRRRKADLA
jgi:hypothetical protein